MESPTESDIIRYTDIQLPEPQALPELPTPLPQLPQAQPKSITFGDAFRSQKQVYAQKLTQTKEAVVQKKDNAVNAVVQKKDNAINAVTKGYDTKFDSTLNKFIKPIDETSDKYINMSPEEREKYKQDRPQKMAKLIFERGVLASKIILLIILLTVAFVNADVSFIAEHPKTFLGEAIAVGALSATATAIIGGTRFADAKTILNAMFVSFLVFFILYVLMEFSGMNAENTNPDVAQNVKITTIFTASVIGLIALTMLPLAWRVWDFKNIRKNKIVTSKYLLEFVSFGLCGGIPMYIIANNRDSTSSGKKLLIATGSFSGLYLLLQSGGFFSNIFGEMPEEPTYRKKSNALVHPMQQI